MRKSNSSELDPISCGTMSELKSAGKSGRASRAKSAKSTAEDAIRIRACEKWQAAGMPNGEDMRFWLEAEQEILQSN